MVGGFLEVNRNYKMASNQVFTEAQKQGNKKYVQISIGAAVWWLRLHLPMQRVRVQSLVGELRSHVPCDQKTKTEKQEQYCNQFNKDFKNGLHLKKKTFKKKKNAHEVKVREA